MGFLFFRQRRGSLIAALVVLFSLSFFVDDIGGTKASDFLVAHFGTETTLWIFRGLSLVMLALVGALYLRDVKTHDKVDEEIMRRSFDRQRDRRP